MTFRLVHELAADGICVAVACRVLNLSRSGFYDWATRLRSARSLADVQLTATILEVHRMSRCSYGAHGCTPSCGWGWRSPAGASGSPG